ncbi:hypothetical protein WMY93_012808 [Mugilogobius chulae]|uniref:Ig-like domain-containing protein n=1 Tax=Mugilogobius chulae TaxID=88201 RepID=A0AAW0P292_9GOBI
MAVRSLLLVLGLTAAAVIEAQGPWRTYSTEFNPSLFHVDDNYEWTSWFNVDHPGGRGDYEQLEAIRFYYKTRVCTVPRALEARTTDWIPARETGEKVHADPTVGFWCLNEEQGPERNCSNYAVRFLCPKECRLKCVMGRVNADCDACMCEDHLVLGSVRGAGGLAAEGAVILRSGKLMTVSDHNGHFRVPGLCPDANTTLTVRLQGHATQNVVVPQSTDRTSVLSVQLQRTEKLHVSSNPESKIRREGQTAAFCCKVAGTPLPDTYQWFHNNSLIEKQSENTLVLKNLQLEQTGEYYCRASGPSGAIKTKPATLRVIGNREQSCNPIPEENLIRLPYDCFQNSTNSFYYNVGKCSPRTCVGQLDSGIRCKDKVSYCCGVAKMEEKKLECQGYQLPTMVVTECGCQKCVETKTIVYGRAVAADNGEPMRFGHVFMNGVRISRTGYKGTFSIQVPPDTERLVLTFVDNMQKFINTTKVLPFNSKGGAVYHEIKLIRKNRQLLLAQQSQTLLSWEKWRDKKPWFNSKFLLIRFTLRVESSTQAVSMPVLHSSTPETSPQLQQHKVI